MSHVALGSYGTFGARAVASGSTVALLIQGAVIGQSRINLLTAAGGESNVYTFIMSRRAGGVGPFLPLATITYASGEVGQKTVAGPFAFSNGDTVSLESQITGDAPVAVPFTGIVQ